MLVHVLHLLKLKLVQKGNRDREVSRDAVRSMALFLVSPAEPLRVRGPQQPARYSHYGCHALTHTKLAHRLPVQFTPLPTHSSKLHSKFP